MSPSKQREPSIDPSTEHDDFINRLRQYHEKRGTEFESEPKVGNRRVDLLRLYRRVLDYGGYDAASDTKQHRLAWRKIGQEFHLASYNLPTLAFSLKTVYYKNLAAFEISEHHKKDPPPKEILEDVSAKGGDLLKRTLENFQRPTTRDESLVNGTEPHDGSDQDTQGTPKEEKMDADDPESVSCGRATRGLRQAPPQRQLFKSEVGTSKQTKQPNGSFTSPTPSQSLNASQNSVVHVPSSAPQALANYEPKAPIPLTLRPVVTPGNNYEQFKAEQKRLRDAAMAKMSKHRPRPRGVMATGTGYPGPNIYARTLLALQSGILEEQEYALHHLVKISHERGDKYTFSSFPPLAENLIKKTLEIGSLLMDVEWEVSYQEGDFHRNGRILNGLHGTPDIARRIQTGNKRKLQDTMEPQIFARQLALVNEAGLVLRNMIMQEENAEYLSRIPTIQDALVVLLNLPYSSAIVEIQQYALEIAEQLTRFFLAKTDDSLFRSLLKFAESDDRGAILTALRAVCRMGSNLGQISRFNDVPMRIVRRICDWMLIEDEDLRSASLDFLYQYTSAPENVETLLREGDVENFIKQLVRILLYRAHMEDKKETNRAKNLNSTSPQPQQPQIQSQAPQDLPIPNISNDLVESLLVYDEPERSSQWLRTCFEEDSNSEITQIALWQAYQVPFAKYGSQRPLLPAKDFITNVSNTFSGASAQVLTQPATRFVIKGIRPRKNPVDIRGRSYMRCHWHIDDQGAECGEFALWPKVMWEHVCEKHLLIPKNNESDKWDLEQSRGRTATCRWAGCRRFDGLKAESCTPGAVGMHVKTHLPDSSERAYTRSKNNVTEKAKGDIGAATTTRSWQMQNTQMDERKEAAGLPLSSVLVLRNLARNIPKIASGEGRGETSVSGDGDIGFVNGNIETNTAGVKKEGAEGEQAERGTRDGLMWRYFAPVKERLFFVMAYNSSLRAYLPELMQIVDADGG